MIFLTFSTFIIIIFKLKRLYMSIKRKLKSIVEQQQKGSGFIIISHYARLFELINVSRVLILVNGKIALEGDSSLIKRIDKEGYDWLKREHNIDIEEEHTMNKVSIGTCATKEVIKNGNK